MNEKAETIRTLIKRKLTDKQIMNEVDCSIATIDIVRNQIKVSNTLTAIIIGTITIAYIYITYIF